MRARHAPVSSVNHLHPYDAGSAGAALSHATPQDLGKPSFQPGSYVYEQEPSGQLHKFRVGRLLGRGGFAKCYEVSDASGSYALKAVNRAALDKPKTLQKLHSEIAIHRKMKDKNIVNFIRTFKDRYYVYILLEKCDNGCLMDLLKVRPLTFPETQFIMAQLVAAMMYMHEHNVIHRDLKPGNIMLDDSVSVKVGDFGLAAELQYDGERKRTVCGTPNYIAPEIIDKQSQGHSFEVDIWSLGVIVCTLLTGQPPFQMEDVDATYRRIRQCRYELSPALPESARDLIRLILQSSPQNRPNLIEIRQHPFFDGTPMLPPTSFSNFGIKVPERPRRSTMAEGFASTGSDHLLGGGAHTGREALRTLNPNSNNALASAATKADAGRMPPPPANMQLPSTAAAPLGSRRAGSPASAGVSRGLGARRGTTGQVPTAPAAAPLAPPAAAVPASTENEEQEDQRELTAMHDRLHRTLCGEPGNGATTTTNTAATGGASPAEAKLPTPPVWVTDCADFSAKYGLCYRLSTGQTGAHFNDSTKLVWQPLTDRVEYYSRQKMQGPPAAPGGEPVVYAKDHLEVFNMPNPPAVGDMSKKVTLIKYFKSYLTRGRNSDKDRVEVVHCTPFAAPAARLADPHVSEDFIYVKRWLSTEEAIIFRLSNKTVQVCFKDGAEVILSSEWKVVTYTEPNGTRRTMPLQDVARTSEEAASRLHRTKNILYDLIKAHQI